MFRRFERILQPTAKSPEEAPPERLIDFYWHYVRQARWFVFALLIIGSIVALLDVSVSVLIGRVITLVNQSDPKLLWQDHWRQLASMAALIAVLRPLGFLAANLVTNQILTPGLTNLTRWQNHWHVVRQSWGFFQNDFAGRIAGRIVQTGASLRESVIAATNSIWHVLVFGASAVFLLAVADARMTAPLLVWFILFLILLRVVVPQMRDRSRGNSEARSTLTGRIVDSYSNILTVKLFARARDEDQFVREALDAHTKAFQHQQRLMTLFGLALSLLNGALLAGSAAMALSMWSAGRITVGVVAMTLQLAWQLNGLSWSVAQNVTSIFEAVGAVQDGMRSIAAPQQMPDPKSARALQVSKGEIAFENVSFGYGGRRAVLRNLDLTIRGGERIGLIGHSAPASRRWSTCCCTFTTSVRASFASMARTSPG